MRIKRAPSASIANLSRIYKHREDVQEKVVNACTKVFRNRYLAPVLQLPEKRSALGTANVVRSSRCSNMQFRERTFSSAPDIHLSPIFTVQVRSFLSRARPLIMNHEYIDAQVVAEFFIRASPDVIEILYHFYMILIIEIFKREKKFLSRKQINISLRKPIDN